MDNCPENCKCEYKCNKNPLNQIYPSQNMCVILNSIPEGLKNLPYGMYTNCDLYYTNRFTYNKRWNWFPNAIFTPSTFDEVRYVFGQFLLHKLPFYVRSGGHCYEQVIPGGYVLDLRNLNAIIPNTKQSTVYFGAGAKLGDVISDLGKIDYAIPTGTCPSVGLSGLALGGGIGYLVRKFGLTSDSIISMEVLTAENKLITVSKDQHAELFWALRGAGNFTYGIVLGFTFKMYKIREVSFLQLRWDWNPKVFAEVYDAWQEWAKTLPDDISAETVFKYKNGKVRLSVNAMKVGPKPFTEWESVFKKFKPTTTNLYKGNYLGAAELGASNYTYPFSKTKSKILFEPLPEGGVDALIDWMALLLEKQCAYEAFWAIEALNPAVLQKTDSAFFPRKAFGVAIGFIYFPLASQQCEAVHLINKSYQEFGKFTSSYSYSNLTDYDLGPDYLRAYWGTNVFRLIEIKKKFDPGDIFRWRQGIPTTNPCLDGNADSPCC